MKIRILCRVCGRNKTIFLIDNQMKGRININRLGRRIDERFREVCKRFIEANNHRLCIIRFCCIAMIVDENDRNDLISYLSVKRMEEESNDE